MLRGRITVALWPHGRSGARLLYRRGRTAVTLVVTGILVLVALLTGAALVSKQAMGAVEEALQPAPTERGERIYSDLKCALCHAIKGKGGHIGPDLSTVGAKRGGQWLKRFVKAPQALVPGAKMPPFRGTDEELEALVAYLGSLE